jgi:hypothetical protein
MKTMIRIMLASAIGALVSIELGTHLGSSSYALVAWACIGALLGFMLVRPKEFFVTLIRESQASVQARRNARREAREEAQRLPEHFDLLRQNDFLIPLALSTMCFWAISGVTYLLMFMDPTPQVLQAFVVHSTLVAYGVLVVLLSLWTLTRDMNHAYQCFEMQDYHYELDDNQLLERLRSSNQWAKTMMFRAALGPIWIAWWIISHPKFVGYYGLLAFAKACGVVVSLERYTAAVGAVGGYIVGWSTGQSGLIGMLAGAVAGGGAFALAKLFLRLLPDPTEDWPSLADCEYM